RSPAPGHRHLARPGCSRGPQAVLERVRLERRAMASTSLERSVARWMMSAWLAAAAGVPAAAAGGAPSPPDPLALEFTIPLDGVSGRIDHMAVDLGRG